MNSDNILPFVTKDNNILELQSLLEHNDFIITHSMLIYIQLA
jgi:hypothetical protein